MQPAYRVRHVELWMTVLLTSFPALSGAEVLTRTEAVNMALARSAELGQLQRTGELARQLSRIGPYPFNPVISAELEGTLSPLSSQEYVRRLSLEQEVDLRGERRARRTVGAGRAWCA